MTFHPRFPDCCFDVLPAPDDTAGPALRPADMTARQAWRWLVAARTRAAVDTGKPQGRVALVEYELRTVAADRGYAPRDEFVPAVHAVDTFDAQHYADVIAARRDAGLPVPTVDAPSSVAFVLAGAGSRSTDGDARVEDWTGCAVPAAPVAS